MTTDPAMSNDDGSAMASVVGFVTALLSRRDEGIPYSTEAALDFLDSQGDDAESDIDLALLLASLLVAEIEEAGHDPRERMRAFGVRGAAVSADVAVAQPVEPTGLPTLVVMLEVDGELRLDEAGDQLAETLDAAGARLSDLLGDGAAIVNAAAEWVDYRGEPL